MKKIYLVVFVLAGMITFQSTYASESSDLMQKANNFYQQGKFDTAAALYQKLVNDNYEDASLFYNLGDAYYRMGKMGLAILYYEKALRLSPNDDDISHNLALANSKIVDKIEPLPKFFIFDWWESLLAFFSLEGWTYTAYFFYIILLVLVGLYFFSKSIRLQKNSLYGGLASLAVLIFLIVIISVKLNRELNVKNAIILEPAAIAKVSPDSESSDAFVIHEGSKVTVEDNVNDWVEIKLNDGKVGWLDKRDLGMI
jgi:tetratricopeptide (TPR) repeat protein